MAGLQAIQSCTRRVRLNIYKLENTVDEPFGIKLLLESEKHPFKITWHTTSWIHVVHVNIHVYVYTSSRHINGLEYIYIFDTRTPAHLHRLM